VGKVKKVILVLSLLLLAIPCLGADVPLAWDASTSENISGYKVYVGRSTRSYNAPISIGNQTTYTVTGLASGVWYFTVTAFDAAGNESDYSNEVSKLIGAASVDPPAIPAVISVSVPSITTQYATVTWITNIECSGTVYYGITAPLTQSVKANNLGVTDHLAVIGPLVSKTHYLFKVSSVCNGQSVESDIRTFNTK
jgi:hypothetical protein